MEPGHGNVSGLSAAIRHRLVTEEEVARRTLERHPFRAVEKFVQEVCWRSYWKGWLERHPEVWRGFVEAARRIEADEALCEACRVVEEGRAGAGVMDAFARELRRTGYLHNHARMWWASYWVHYRGLPWVAGARFFLRHLLDADAASNTLSWRWVAGLQTRGKTYVATEENIRRYCAGEILEAAGGAGLGAAPVRVGAVLEDAGEGGEPGGAETRREGREESAEGSQEGCGESAGRPQEGGGAVALLLHAEDLSVETGPLKGLRPVVIVALRPGADEPAPRADWLGRALDDAARRAEAHYGCRVVFCDGIGDAARKSAEAGAGALAAMRPFTGPLEDRLREWEAEGGAGPRLELWQRGWDRAVLPLARRGFFPFWKAVSARLARGGVEALLTGER